MHLEKKKKSPVYFFFKGNEPLTFRNQLHDFKGYMLQEEFWGEQKLFDLVKPEEVFDFAQPTTIVSAGSPCLNPWL